MSFGQPHPGRPHATPPDVESPATGTPYGGIPGDVGNPALVGGAAADQLAVSAGWLAAARSVTVLTGAGVSTDSGIPDYRGPNGVWIRDPQAQRTVTLADYVGDPAVRRRAWQARLGHGAWQARPNAGHAALVDLERSGRLRLLVTQNVDGLHQRAGSSREAVVELHGTVWDCECLACGARTSMADELGRVRGGDPDPACRGCGGILKSATISFGQPLVAEQLAAALAAARDCEVFLAVGSSLSVQPAAGLCSVARRSGARLVIVNGEPTGYDPMADAVVRGRISTVLPALVAAAVAAPVGR